MPQRRASASASPSSPRPCAAIADGRARRLLPGPDRPGDRRGELARRGRPRGVLAPRWVEPLRLDYRGTRCSSCRRRRRASPRSRRSACSRGSSPTLGEPGRVREARARGRARARSRRRRRLRPARARLPRPAPRRRSPAPATEPPGGTVYLCAVDGDRMAVSFIQSLYYGLRLRRRRARHRRRAPEPRRLLRGLTAASSRAAPVPHDHPRNAPARRRAARAVRRHGRLHPGAGPHAARLGAGRRRARSAGGARPAALPRRRRRRAPRGGAVGPGRRARAARASPVRRDDDVDGFGGGQAILSTATRWSAAPIPARTATPPASDGSL